MINILLVGVLDSKIVDNEGEGEWACIVFPKAGREGHGCVTVGRQMFYKMVIGNASGLGEAVHPFSDFDVDVTVVDEGTEIVLGHDGVGDDGDGDAHVGIVFGFHGSIKVKILEVACHETGVRGRDDAVEEGLDGDEVGGFCADVSIVLDAVPSDSKADAMGVGFFGAVGGDDTKVRWLDVFWYFGNRNEEHGVGAGGHVFSVALGEAADLVGAGGDPGGALTAIAEFGVLGDLACVWVEGVAVKGGVLKEGEQVGGEGFFGGDGNSAGVGACAVGVRSWEWNTCGGGRCRFFGEACTTAAAASGGASAVLEGRGGWGWFGCLVGRFGSDGERECDGRWRCIVSGGRGRWRRRGLHPQRWRGGVHPQRWARRVVERGRRWLGETGEDVGELAERGDVAVG